MPSDVSTAAPSTERLVWDIPVRVVHWGLVLAVVGCYVSDKLGPAYFTWHVACGCTVLVLATFRVVWGFVGTRHARFFSFLRGPRAILAYLRGQSPGPAGGVAAGHNPLGGLAIVVMLGLLLTQATTGLFSNDEIENVGPFFGWVSDHQSARLTSLHHRTFTLLQCMVGLHVAAVLFYTFAKRSPLIRAMFSGRKPATAVPVNEEIHGSRLWLALAILIPLVLVLIYLLYAAPVASLSSF